MPISELLPPRVPVNREVLEKLSDHALMQVAIQLYREASLTIQACAQNHAPAKLTDGSRAICCGLLVRLAKYMLAVDTLVTHQESCADVLMAINRCMFESAVNMTYLLRARFYSNSSAAMEDTRAWERRRVAALPFRKRRKRWTRPRAHAISAVECTPNRTGRFSEGSRSRHLSREGLRNNPSPLFDAPQSAESLEV
ncbi:MAG: hypothetical protein ACRD3G_18265 [Vicinamibacterales bacterium]